MVHAPVPSIPQHSARHHAALARQLRRWLIHELRHLRPTLLASATRCQADRYRKHFDAFAHAMLLLFHGLSGSPSLRQSYAAVAACPDLLALTGHGSGPEAQLVVSFSQLAASNTSRPAAFLTGLLPPLVARVQATGQAGGLPPTLHLLDSTFLRLSLQLAPWLSGGPEAEVSGLRLQVQYAPAFDLPEHVLLTDTRTNDCQGFDQLLLDDPVRLAALREQTLVVDLGYYSHARFARLRVEAELPVPAALPRLPAARITIRQDQRVTVGSPNNRAGAVLRGLRLVTADVAPAARAARRRAKTVRYHLITDRWDLLAAEVVQLYLWRWQIELFFRWLKSHLHLPRLLGYSRNAVELSIGLALVVHLLCVLAAQALGLGRRSPALRAQLPWALAHLRREDLPAPSPAVQQLTFPHWELDPVAPT